MNSVNQFQILDEVVNMSLYANALWKSMNSSPHPQL